MLHGNLYGFIGLRCYIGISRVSAATWESRRAPETSVTHMGFRATGVDSDHIYDYSENHVFSNMHMGPMIRKGKSSEVTYFTYFTHLFLKLFATTWYVKYVKAFPPSPYVLYVLYVPVWETLCKHRVRRVRNLGGLAFPT